MCGSSIEASGGIAPQPLARLHRNSRLAASRGARDRTKYGLSRASPRSYLTHHIQRIAFAAVRANAKHARWMISCFKTSVCAGAEAAVHPPRYACRAASVARHLTQQSV